MKIEAAEMYIHVAVNFCQKNYCYKCPIRDLCGDIFHQSFVSEQFLNLALKCEKFCEGLVERGFINE